MGIQMILSQAIPRDEVIRRMGLESKDADPLLVGGLVYAANVNGLNQTGLIEIHSDGHFNCVCGNSEIRTKNLPDAEEFLREWF